MNSITLAAHSWLGQRLLVSALSLALLAAPAFASPPPPRSLSFSFVTPTAVFLQTGAGEEQTRAYTIGAQWDLPWHKQYDFGQLSSYVETSIGRWSTDRPPGGSGWLTQIGLTPVLRYHLPGELHPWFAEIGVGANVIVPIYRSNTKAFSTEFNFGDHIAVGRRFGDGLRYELALRLQHFSNAGINEPNPGENFLQLRYSLHFR